MKYTIGTIETTPAQAQEPATYPKLSALIREGCKDTRPITRNYVRVDAFGVVNACALGAAMYALKLDYDDYLSPLLSNALGYNVMSRTVTHDGTEMSVWALAIHLNDDLGWSREAIADLLESKGL